MYASFLLYFTPTHHAFITDDAFLKDTKKGAQKSSVHPDISL